jgi:GT2 family glycosyltransferase
MRIGIGVTTYNRPEHLDLFIRQLGKHTLFGDVKTYIHFDENERKGIAYGKNICIYNLKDCDYIFLFDDDCFPISDYWMHPFINSGLNHALYMNESYEPILSIDGYTSYLHCSGVFMFLTKKVIEKVGYYNPEYGIYGLEHAGYSQRIYRAGLTPCFFPVLDGTDKLIYSLDHQGEGDWGIKHKGSLPEEERKKLTEINDIIYHKECNAKKNFYNFKP